MLGPLASVFHSKWLGKFRSLKRKYFAGDYIPDLRCAVARYGLRPLLGLRQISASWDRHRPYRELSLYGARWHINHWEIIADSLHVYAKATDILVCVELVLAHTLAALVLPLASHFHTCFYKCSLLLCSKDPPPLWAQRKCAVGSSTRYAGLTTPVCKLCLVGLSQSRRKEPASGSADLRGEGPCPPKMPEVASK